jgi:hypothetical protein
MEHPASPWPRQKTRGNRSASRPVASLDNIVPALAYSDTFLVARIAMVSR